jgi:hypothetical protein
MMQFAHFGARLSRWIALSAALSRMLPDSSLGSTAPPCRPQLRLQPQLLKPTSAKSLLFEMRKRSAFLNRLRRIQEYWRKMMRTVR